MGREQLARWWFAATAVAVFTGLVVQLFVTADADADGARFPVTWQRVLNVFAFFTIQSNLIVGITTGLLALGRGGRSIVFRTARLLGVVNITLTFIVFHAVLRDLQDLTGQAAFADVLLHSVSPVLCVSGWIFFGPSGLVDRAVVGLAVGYLLLWGGFTLVRGEMIDWYPYPFMDPNSPLEDPKGYVAVTVNLVIVAVVFLALAAATLAADRRLTSRRAPDDAAG
jgi:hypothetical protein